MRMIFINKYFVFTVGSIYRVKLLTTGLQRFRRWRRGWNGGAEVTETAVERLLCCGFRRTGKTMGQMYQCWWRIRREINVFFFYSFEYHMFYVSYPFVMYLLTLPRTKSLINLHSLIQPHGVWYVGDNFTFLLYIPNLWRIETSKTESHGLILYHSMEPSNYMSYLR
jgi:hypothetical protein